MSPKRTAEPAGGQKKRKAISMETKIDIIRRSENGQSNSAICVALGLARTTVATIVADKKRIQEYVKAATPM